MTRKLNLRSNNTSHAPRRHSVSKHTNPSSLSRTPSSVHFSRSTSSNSLPAELPPSNPVFKPPIAHAGSNTTIEETKTPPSVPSFTVSSSAVNVNNPNKPPGRTLNPAAKEFELPTNGTSSFLYGAMIPDSRAAALFAMASHRMIPNMPTPALASDYTTSWNVLGMERQSRVMMPPDPPINHAISSDEKTVERLVGHLRTTYMLKCKEQKLHMVAVLNLENHTNDKDLLNIFSAMSASEAIMLTVNDIPYSIFNTISLFVRRGVGVVFFLEKDFAMLGVEKLNNFVPNGQHQQLTVRYCGPDPGSPIPPNNTTVPVMNPNPNPASNPGLHNQLPWILPAMDLDKVHEEMRLIYDHLGEPLHYMVAIHGLCSSSAIRVLKKNVLTEDIHSCERWPPTNLQLLPQLKYSIPWRCRSVSAVVWYTSEYVAKAAVRDLNNCIPEGQQQKVCLCLLGPPKRQSHHISSNRDTPCVGDQYLKDTIPRITPSLNFATAITMGSQPKKVSRAGNTPSTSLSCTSTSANDNVAIFAHIDSYFLNKFADKDYYMVAVHKLDIQTDQKNLHEIFYPNGAVYTDLYPDVVMFDGKPRRSGVALFSSQGMAMEAASRFNDFVPNGQNRPLLTRYLARPESSFTHIGNKNNLNASYSTWKESTFDEATIAPGTRNIEQIVTAFRSAGVSSVRQAKNDLPPQQAQRGTPPFSTPCAPLVSLEDLLCSIQTQLSTFDLNAERLEEDMVNLANHPDSAEDTGAKLAKLLVNTLVRAKHQSVMLSPPLSGAISGLHDRLDIPKRSPATPDSTYNDSQNKEIHRNMEKRITFVKQIAKELLFLVTQEEVPPQTRRVVGTLCAYIFQYSYLRDSPCKFAVEFLTKRRAERKRAAASASQDPTILSKYNHQQPWVYFVESLDDMTRFWLKNKLRAKSDEYARRYLSLRAELLGESESLTSSAVANTTLGNPEKSTKTEPSIFSPCGNVDYFSNKETMSGGGPNRDSVGGPTATNTTTGQGVASANLSSALLTPSARPTPLRVTKGSMTSGSGNRYKQTPLEGVSNSAQALPPRVMLTPGSNQTQGVSANISLESAVDHSSARVHSFMSDLSAQSPQAAHYFQTFSTVVGKRNPSPSTRGTTVTEGGDHHVLPGNPTRSAAPLPETNSTAPSNAEAGNEMPPRPPQMVINHRSDVSECTVYITKLPSSFTASQVRRLFLNFGSFTKVRLCHDDKESAVQAAAPLNNHGKLCFVFVEFAESLSAKAIVEYFRNASHIPNAFDFMRQPQQSNGTDTSTSSASVDALTAEQKIHLERDIGLLSGTRASPARKPIHDQQYLDAVLRSPTPSEIANFDISSNASIVERGCLFGVLMPDLAIETYNSNSCMELRPPMASALNNSNSMTNPTSSISVAEEKTQLLAVKTPSQPTLCQPIPLVDSTGLIIMPPDGQSTTKVANSTPSHNPFVENDDDLHDEEEKGPDLDIQALTDAWIGHPSIGHDGFKRWGTKVPPEGVIGDSVDGINFGAKLTHSREPSLVRFNDTRSEDNSINSLPNHGNIWMNFEM
ncbi:unnamed protein product [Phytomonas sp. Hart1]|nr:unnamed protein product [Phytomonas sp. Hart1]|eukprot:CCW69106.1 unnamed protein product [Phytomonas sp. isolate Hart1]